MKKLLKKINISKKTAILATILIVSVVAPMAIYLYMQDKGEVKSWYSSNWLYRRMIGVAGNGTTLFNEDLLITVDTQTLISANKMQSDCGDIRFVDNDNTTVLDYWIEDDCNTTETKVWVRIPSLPSSGKSIYLYYGNETIPNGSLPWSGSINLLSDTSCPSGWTRNTDLDNLFPYGSSSYGTTLGSLSHSHGDTTAVTSTSISDTSLSGSPGLASATSSSHAQNSLKVNVGGSSDILPPYLNMIYCYNTHFSLPTNLISLFSESIPSGWSRFSELDNKFPRGASTYGSTGGNTTHNHSFTGYTTSVNDNSLNIEEFILSNGGDGAITVAANGHTHSTLSGSTENTNYLPPYMDMIFAKNNSEKYITEKNIVITNILPPLGWNRYSLLDDRIPRGGTTAEITGGSTTHTHNLVITTGAPSSSIEGVGSGTNYASSSHTHSVSTITQAASNLPPSIKVLFIQRKISLSTTVGTEKIYNQEPTSPTNLFSKEQINPVTTPFAMAENEEPIAPIAPTDLLTEGSTNPIKVTDTTPEFSAIFRDNNTEDTAHYYQIEVNTSPYFNGTVMWDSTKTSMSTIANGSRTSDISYAGTALSLNAQPYYWRIRFWDAADTQGQWSNTASFIMSGPPSTPTNAKVEGKLSPTQIIVSQPKFSAMHIDNNGDNATYYEIEVNTNSSFSGTVMWDTGKLSMTSTPTNSYSPEFTYIGSTLTMGNTYYWRIRFWDTDGNVSPWSDTSSFLFTYAHTYFEGVKLEGIKVHPN